MRALLHRPAVLLMDEASVGLDPASRRDLLAALRADVAARNTTVLWATHLVEEAHAADRVLVLHQGKTHCRRHAGGRHHRARRRHARSRVHSTHHPFTQGVSCSMKSLLSFGLSCLTGAALAQPTVWVSSEKDNALTVVDAATLAVQGTVATCKRPRHMHLLAGGKQVLVACAESHAADLIDVATKKSVRRVPLGDDPEAFDLSPDGKTLYVSNEDDGALGFVDVASGKMIKQVPIGKEPEGVKTSPDGKLVYVTSEVANMVHVVDVATAKVLHNVKVGKRPRRMWITPDGAELWVTNELDASVSIIATKDHTLIHTMKFTLPGARAQDITPVGIAMTKDGKRAFVGMGRANHVAFVDVAQRKVTQMVLAGKRAWNVALDKAETRLYVVNGLSDDMTVIDVASAKALKTIAVGRVPYQALVIE